MSHAHQMTVSPDFPTKRMSGWFIFNTWLQKTLNLPIHLELYPDFSSQRQAIASDKVDIIYANPYDAAMLVRAKGFIPVARPMNKRDECIVAVAAGNTVQQVEALQPGCRVVSTDDPDIRMLGMILLEPADLNAGNIQAIQVESYPLVAKALMRGEAEAGFFLAEAFAELSSLIRKELRPLVQSQINDITHVMLLGPRLAAQQDLFIQALQAMPQTARGVEILAELGFSACGEALRPWSWIAHLHPAKSGYLTRSGLVRVLGWPFLYRNLTARDLAEFLEIYGLPLRIGRYPAGASASEKNTLMQAVLSIGHNAAGILPEGMRIEFQRASDGAADPFLAMMGWAERAISKAILGGTLTSEVGATGSYAAAEVHNGVRKDILKSDLALIARSLSRDLIAPLAALNTPLSQPPRLRFDLGEAADLGTLAEALPKLVGTGLRIPARWAYDHLKIPRPEGDEPLLGTPSASASVAQNSVESLKQLQPAADTPDVTTAITDALADQAATPWAGVVERVRAIAERVAREGGDLAQLRDRLLASYAELDSAELAQVMALGFSVAHLAGIEDVDRGD